MRQACWWLPPALIAFWVMRGIDGRLALQSHGSARLSRGGWTAEDDIRELTHYISKLDRQQIEKLSPQRSEAMNN